MKYSVALCTYNGAKYIVEQLTSIVRQSVLPSEIVVCDDCSEDNTIDLVSEFAQKHLDLTWRIEINEINLGYVKNFEKAISLCSEEVIFLCDQDDVWFENKAEKCLQYFKEHSNVSVLFTNGFAVNENLEKEGWSLMDRFQFTEKQLNKFNIKKTYKNFLCRHVVTGATMALRKSFVEYVTPFPDFVNKSFIHDSWVSVVAALELSLGYINEPLILYRLHAGQNVGVKKKIKNSFNSRIESLLKSINDEKERNVTLLGFYKLKNRSSNFELIVFLEKRQIFIDNLLDYPSNKLDRLRRYPAKLMGMGFFEFETFRKYLGNLRVYLLS